MSSPSGRVIGIGIALALAAVGCGARGGQPSWRKPQEVKGGPRGPVTIHFVPRTPPARGYNDPPRTPAPRSELGNAVVAEVERVSAQLGKPAPVADGRLFAAARELAEVAPHDLPLVYSLIEFALQRNGIIEPSPHLVVIWGPTDDADEIVKSLADRLPAILGAADFARVGVGAAERDDGQGVTILAFQSSSIDTRPIPRRLPAGGRVRIEATVKPPFVAPQAFVTRPDGAVERLGLAAAAGGMLAAELACGSHRGRQQIEITADDKTGSTVLANFPVWCGEEPPTSLTVHLDADETAPIASREEAEERLVRLVNRDRAKHALPPLDLDARLKEVARRHCEEMRETGVVAHLSPRTGSAADRVKAGGIRSSVVLENVARAYGIGEAEEGLMNSPGHRANILSKDATHMAIGVVLGEDVAGRREIFVTQLFIRKTARIDRRAVGDQVRQRVQASGLNEDPRLSEVAQELADGIARGSSPNDASVVANRRLSGMNLPYAKVTTLVTTVADLAAFKPKDSLRDGSIRVFGAGIAQGDHEVMGEGAIHIVLLLAHK
ncbi:MAG TPA: CAP domain-containing protein [Kofleriaceae bacterium]|nr:CAP domain-containing protein [Kofleriaceae bacterium]